ncbi:MAG: histidine phosphatase family protein [Anaeromyxobacteraceae bacterium]
MSKRIYLVRHGRAEASNPGGDAARRLTPEGRLDLEGHVRRIRAELQVSRVVASPFTRCRETAQILATVLGVRADAEAELASGVSDARGVLLLAARCGAGTVLVGHNPELGGAVATVAGREVEFPPGTIAAVDVDGGEFGLAWVRVP